MVLSDSELIDEVHSLMQRSSSLADFIHAVAINCERNGSAFSCAKCGPAVAWKNIADELRKVADKA